MYTVKELIEQLQKHDPNKKVMIQQGEEHDYMAVYSVKELELSDADEIEEDNLIKAVVIQYQ